MKPLILVDGSSYLFRAFHALPPLNNSKGQPTGAIYGVVNMLRKLIADYTPAHIAVVFDAKGKTFREELYADYKANRPPMASELVSQIAPLHKIIQAMGLPLLVVEGIEADDVIGTLASRATNQNMSVLISTGDKDFAQLVNDKITLVNTMNGETLDPIGVEKKFGIPPNRIIDYLALVGDAVDNVPGVPKVGPKTAVKWLQQYGSLDNLIQHANEIDGKIGENLRGALTQLPLFRQLLTIHTTAKLPLSLAELKPKAPNTEELAHWFKELEFKTWLKESAEPPKTLSSQEYETILTKAAFEKWVKLLKEAPLFAIDTETTSLNAIEAKLVGLSFATEAGKAAYLPLAHDYAGAPQQLDLNWVLQQLKPLLEDSKPKKLGQNLKYDKNVLANYGIELRGIAYDTLLESYVLNSTSSRHDLDTLAIKYLGYNTIRFEDIAGKGAKQLPFNQISLEKAAPYSAEDADISLRLHETLWPQVAKEAGLKRVFEELEMPLMPVLAKMERNGVLVDAKFLNQQSQDLEKQIKILEDKAFQLAGTPFNLASPKQLQEILFVKQQLPITSKTPTGQPSTAEDVLQELALLYPLPKIILEHRTLSKLKSTYTDKLPEQISPTTGRIHASFHQAVTSTGRLSSSDPNLQNIPIRTKEGRKIRQAFIAPSGFKIVAADYSQIELRLMAHLAQDPGLLHAFAHNIDIHRATAAEVFGVLLDAVTADQRRSAKAINFGLIYGMSAFGLAKQLGIEPSAADQYIKVYFSRYPGVQAYMENTKELARKQGHVETLFGRRLYLPEINVSNMMRRKAAERAAINAPLQGTAADIIKRAMINIDSNLQLKLILQVHDELVFEVPEKEVEAAKKSIREYMCTAVELSVPLGVEIGAGNNWDEAHG